MNRLSLLTLASLTAALLPLTAFGANRRQNFDELTASSDKVIVGTVGVKSSYWGDDSRIYTEVVVSPDVTIKGAEEGALVVQMLGGTVGDTRLAVSDGPEFPEGERVVVFLKKDRDHFVVVGRGDGSIPTSSAEAASALDGAFANVERTGRQRMGHKRWLAESYLNRTASRITTQSRATTATQLGCYGVDGAKWGTSPASYKIGSSVPANWAPSIDASAATWSSAGAAFRLVNDSVSSNELSYVDLVGKYGSSYSNTFAVTSTWSSVSTNQISKATIEINTKWPWSTSGEANMADVQNILTHEFGHWMRLLDIYSPTSCSEVTMWGSASFGETKKRTLDQADIDGFVSLYGGNGSTLSAPVLTAPANGVTGVPSTPTLTWNAVSGANSYEVYFGTTPSPALVTIVTTTAFQPGILTGGTTYFWRVVAKSSNASATSTTYSFTTAGPTTAGPVLLSPANGATGVPLTTVMKWNAVPGATAYDLYIGTTTTPARIGSIGGTAVTVSGFHAATTYYWRVVARTASGSYSSDLWSFRTQ
jgi:hypothetical protein